MKSFKKCLPVCFLLFFIMVLGPACSKLQETSVEPEPTVPVANAGQDQAVFVDLQCQLDGSLSSGETAIYSWSVKTLPAGATTPTIVSSNANKAYFTPDTIGTYEFELQLSNTLGASTDAVSVTVGAYAAPTIEAGFFGVCAHLQSHDGGDLSQITQMMADAGVQFVRFDFDWKDIEPDNDNFVFSKYDNILAELNARGIKVLGILDYDNDWSNPTTGDVEDMNHFADYVYNTVKHFGSQIKFWQVWNEPNNQNFWPSPSAENYTNLLKRSYGAAKQADPEAVVILGGLVGNGQDALELFGIPFGKANFLSDIYVNGGKDYFDVASIHPYNYSIPIDSTASLEAAVAAARAVMVDNSDGSKPLWITELGPLYMPREPILLLSDRGYSDNEIASWLTLIYTNLQSHVDKLFWYEFRDNPKSFDLLNPDPNWEGLVESDYETKEAYGAYRDLPK
jgi:hypothetical protein